LEQHLVQTDLNLLYTFDVLLAEGNVARAARRLRLSAGIRSLRTCARREGSGPIAQRGACALVGLLAAGACGDRGCDAAVVGKVGIALAAPKPAPGTVLAFPLAHLWFLYVLLGLYILLLAVRSLMLALPVRGRGLSVAKLRSRPVAC